MQLCINIWVLLLQIVKLRGKAAVFASYRHNNFIKHRIAKWSNNWQSTYERFVKCLQTIIIVCWWQFDAIEVITPYVGIYYIITDNYLYINSTITSLGSRYCTTLCLQRSQAIMCQVTSSLKHSRLLCLMSLL